MLSNVMEFFDQLDILQKVSGVRNGITERDKSSLQNEQRTMAAVCFCWEKGLPTCPSLIWCVFVFLKIIAIKTTYYQYKVTKHPPK